MATMEVTGRDGALTVAQIKCKDASEVEKVLAKLSKLSTRSYRVTDDDPNAVKVVCNKSQLSDLRAVDWSFAPVFTFARASDGTWEVQGRWEDLRDMGGKKVMVTRRDGTKQVGYAVDPYECEDGIGRAAFSKHAPPREEGESLAQVAGCRQLSGWSPPHELRIPAVGELLRGEVVVRVSTRYIPNEFGSLGGSPEYDSGYLWWAWTRPVAAPAPSASSAPLIPEMD